MFYPAVISHRKTVQDGRSDKSESRFIWDIFFFKPFDEEARNPCPLSMNPTRSKSNAQIPVGFIKNIPHCPLPFFLPALRFVDGIEAENQSGSGHKFDFSPSATQSFLPSPDSATSSKYTHTHTHTHTLTVHIPDWTGFQ